MNGRITSRFPLLLPLFAYISGMILDLVILPIPEFIWVPFSAVLVAFLLYRCFPGFFSTHLRRIWFGICIFLLFHMIGIINHQFFRFGHFKGAGDQNYALVRIDHPPRERENSILLSGSQVEISTGNSMGGILLYLEKDERIERLTPGALIIVKQVQSTLNTATNPGEFNYGRYLSAKGIRHYQYVPSKSWRLWRSGTLFSFVNYSLKIKTLLLEAIYSWPVEQEAQSLAKALLLGERKSLDPSQLDAYASAGAMHILAVSGLHTGIFYLVLAWLFKPLKKWRYGKHISTVTIVTILWSYAFITGLSASVVRAVCMFSILALGNSMQRRTNVYNTILASAFLLLLVWPGYLFQVGFQLSYAAVVGDSLSSTCSQGVE